MWGGGGGGAVVQHFIKFCHLLQISNLRDGFGSPRVWPSLYCHSTFNNFALGSLVLHNSMLLNRGH